MMVLGRTVRRKVECAGTMSSPSEICLAVEREVNVLCNLTVEALLNSIPRPANGKGPRAARSCGTVRQRSATRAKSTAHYSKLLLYHPLALLGPYYLPPSSTFRFTWPFHLTKTYPLDLSPRLSLTTAMTLSVRASATAALRCQPLRRPRKAPYQPRGPMTKPPCVLDSEPPPCIDQCFFQSHPLTMA